MSVDGTGQFSSTQIRCPECCERSHANGETEYYHQLLGAAIVHPDKAQVFPVFPETITHREGERKNDYERNAAKRLLPALRAAAYNLSRDIYKFQRVINHTFTMLSRQWKRPHRVNQPGEQAWKVGFK